VPEGARVLLGFEAGDPKRPYCALWESEADVTTLTFDGGSEDVARTADTVNAGYLMVSSEDATGYLWLTLGGVPALYFPGTVVGLAAAAAAAAVESIPAGRTGAVVNMTDGRITSGNSKLKA